ncbi:MAG: hypothetical protein AB7S74_01745 [Hyphomicrobium sp.]
MVKEQKKRRTSPRIASKPERNARPTPERDGSATVSLRDAIALRSEQLWESAKIYGSGALIGAAVLGAGLWLKSSGSDEATRYLAFADFLKSANEDGTAIIEGRIAEDNQPLSKNFVAYQWYRRYVSQGEGNIESKTLWIPAEKPEASSFALVSDDGERIEVANTDYTFWPREPLAETHAPPPVLPIWDHDSERSRDGWRELRGLAVGKPIVVIGDAQSKGAIKASYVLAGPKSRIIARLSASAADNRSLSWLHWLLIGGGGVLLASMLGLWAWMTADELRFGLRLLRTPSK